MNACSYTTPTPTPALMDMGSTKGILGSLPAGLHGDRLQASSHDSGRPRVKACSSRATIQSQSFETWQALGLKFQEEPCRPCSQASCFGPQCHSLPCELTIATDQPSDFQVPRLVQETQISGLLGNPSVCLSPVD